jgi:molecular chaperone GrpE
MSEKGQQKKTDKHERDTHEVPVRKSVVSDAGSVLNEAGAPGAAGGLENTETAGGNENAGIDGTAQDGLGNTSPGCGYAEPGDTGSGRENAEPGDEGARNAAPELEKAAAELEKVKSELENKTRQCEDYFDMLQRKAAEFDNFKKRSLKEKEALYVDAVADIVGAFIPVIDNIERALQAISSNDSAQSLKEGVEMVYKQFKDVLRNLGVDEIKALGGEFDPNLHNAAMHVEDDSFGRNMVVEEFQKGYIYKDRVIRYSMVKVAN